MVLTSAVAALRILIEFERCKALPWARWPVTAAFTNGDVKTLRTITDIHASREESSVYVFDGALKAAHRDRAAFLARNQILPSASAGTAQFLGQGQGSSKYHHHPYRTDPLLCEVASRLLDRLEDCKGRSFINVAVIGGAVLQVLDQLAHGRSGVQHVTVVDTSPGMISLIQDMSTPLMHKQSSSSAADVSAISTTSSTEKHLAWPKVVCQLMDPKQELLPLEPGMFDLVISCLGLHWINDLPTFMAQCRFALKDDGLFLGALFAGDTHQELRIACALAQMERQGGVSAVVSPFAQVRDGGNLLTRGGLSLPAVDMDEFVVRYGGGPTEVVSHMRALGEVNAVIQRQAHLQRDTALASGAVYQSMFGDEEDGSVPATYQVMYLTGWAPHESQQKPAKRGSATVSFQELADGLVGTGVATGGRTGEGDEDATCGTTARPPSKPK